MKFCQEIRELTAIRITRPFLDEFVENYEVPIEVLNTISGVLDKEIEIETSEEYELRVATNSVKSAPTANEYDAGIIKLQKLIVEMNTPEYKNLIVEYRKKAEELLKNDPDKLTPENNYGILGQVKEKRQADLVKSCLDLSFYDPKYVEHYKKEKKEIAKKAAIPALSYVLLGIAVVAGGPVSMAIFGATALGATVYTAHAGLAKLKTQYDALPESLKGHGRWNDIRMSFLWRWGLEKEYLEKERVNREVHNKVFAWFYNVEQCVQAIKDVIKEIENSLESAGQSPEFILQQLFLIKNFTLEVLEEIISGNINKLTDKSLASKEEEEFYQTKIYVSLLKLCLTGLFTFQSKIYFFEETFIPGNTEITPTRQEGQKGSKYTEIELWEEEAADAIVAMKNYFMYSMIELRESLNTQITQPTMGLEPESPAKATNNKIDSSNNSGVDLIEERKIDRRLPYGMHSFREVFNRLVRPSPRILELEASNVLTNNHISK